jgi:type VI secretion system protein
MDMTTIQPIQNNPIKFAINIEEALTKLLIEKNKSYMGAEEAMKEAYDDIKSHQVAVISGIQASLVYVLKRFEPENLIERLEKESPVSANIPIHRQAKLWNKFEELYDTIESEAEDDFNRLFGQEFAKAYDEQVALLKKERKK